MSWETWEQAAIEDKKFDALDDDDEKGQLLEGCDDWEEWSDKEEEPPEEEAHGSPSAPSAPKPKPKPKPRPRPQKEKKKKDTVEELDAETRRRRELMKQRVNDFEAASNLLGDIGDSKKVPVAHMKPKDAAEYADFARSIADVITIFSEHSKYVDFLLGILKEVKELSKHEPLERLSKSVAVLYNERQKEEKSGSAGVTEEKRKMYKNASSKKDLMDAALDGRNRAQVDVEDDFM